LAAAAGLSAATLTAVLQGQTSISPLRKAYRTA
jgi:hypothetical protein